jgi:hypothetical protein
VCHAYQTCYHDPFMRMQACRKCLRSVENACATNQNGGLHLLLLFQRYLVHFSMRQMKTTCNSMRQMKTTCNAHRLNSTSPFKTLPIRSLCHDQESNSEVVDSEIKTKHRWTAPDQGVSCVPCISNLLPWSIHAHAGV